MKNAKTKRLGLHYFFCFFVVWMSMMVSFAIGVFGVNQPTIFSQVDEIASDGTYVYTIDDGFNTLCRYNIDGELVWSTSFTSTGSSRIFCDGDALCRYDYRENTVYVYDADGKVDTTYEAEYDELEDKGFFKKYEHHRTEVAVSEDISCVFKDRLIGNSVMTVTQNGIAKSFTVEPWGGHLLGIGIVLLNVFMALYGAYDLICFIIKTHEERQTR